MPLYESKAKIVKCHYFMVLSPLALMFFENPLAIIEAVLLIFLWLQHLKI